MGLRNCSNSARLLKDLHGVRLGSANQSEGMLEVENHCGSHGEPSRAESLTDLRVVPVKQEFPVWKTLWESRPAWFRVQGCQNCASLGDRSVLETIVNVATSMPFIAIGLQAPRKKPAARLYADSLIGVGVASSLYHISRGEARKVFRFGDYVMIAAASLCLNSATRDDNPRALMLASAFLIPVQPMLVTVLHTGMMEATFARRATNEPKLRRAHSLHKLSSVIGATLFVADDVLPQTPYIHAAWHLAAALGIATSAKLLN